MKKRGENPEVSFSNYIEHTNRSLKLLRMWSFDYDSPKWQFALITLNASISSTCLLLLITFELKELQNASDLQAVASGISCFWFHFLGLFKGVYFVWNLRNVDALIRQLEECYNLSLAIANDSEGGFSKLRGAMKVAQESSKKFTYLWAVFMMYGMVHWCMTPIILQLTISSMNTSVVENERILPYPSWIPWDTTKPLGYWNAYLLQFVGSIVACIGHISYDVLYVSLIIMICAQFKYLNYFLTTDQVKSDSEEKSAGSKRKLTDGFLERKLQRSRVYHDTILRFLRSLEALASPVMFVECVGVIWILCLVSFEAVTLKLKGDIRNTIRVWNKLEYICGGFTQLFVFCYYANRVTALGLEVADSAWSSGWESSISEKDYRGDFAANKKGRGAVRFLILEIITRAQRPVHLTGGPFYVLSLETYCAVVSAAFSYLAVLRELVEE